MGVLLHIIMALHVFVLISTIIHLCFHQSTSALLPPMSSQIWTTTTTSRPSYPPTTSRPSYSTTTTRPSYPATTRPSYPPTTTRPSYPPTTSKPQTTTTEAPEGVCPDGWFNAHRLGCYDFDYV